MKQKNLKAYLAHTDAIAGNQPEADVHRDEKRLNEVKDVSGVIIAKPVQDRDIGLKSKLAADAETSFTAIDKCCVKLRANYIGQASVRVRGEYNGIHLPDNGLCAMADAEVVVALTSANSINAVAESKKIQTSGQQDMLVSFSQTEVNPS